MAKKKSSQAIKSASKAKKPAKAVALKKVAKPAKKAAKPATKKSVKKAATPKKAAPKSAKKSANPTKTLKAQKVPAAKKSATSSKTKNSAKTATAAPKAVAAKPSVKPNLIPSSAMKTLGKIVPLDDRIVVTVSEKAKMTPGGLYIPDSVSDVSGNLKGSVIAIGRGHLTKKGNILGMDVQVGDEVIFNDHSGTKLKWNETEIVVLRESEVLGVSK